MSVILQPGETSGLGNLTSGKSGTFLQILAVAGLFVNDKTSALLATSGNVLSIISTLGHGTNLVQPGKYLKLSVNMCYSKIVSKYAPA
jgi:preprotein translocase subunit SecG